MTLPTLILTALVLWSLATVPVGVAFGRAFAAGQRSAPGRAPLRAVGGSDTRPGHVA